MPRSTLSSIEAVDELQLLVFMVGGYSILALSTNAPWHLGDEEICAFAANP